MCGRYTYKFTWRQIHEQLTAFDLALADAALQCADPPPRYNVAPTTDVPVLRAIKDKTHVFETAQMRWWLVPSWSKEPSTKYPMFNARSEDAAKKPSFRGPFRYKRCIIPASGFYEWKKLGDKKKQPYYITRADGQVLYLAGLWDCWRDELESCAILTTSPNAEMGELHNRMPCILEPENLWQWCDPTQQDAEAVQPLLGPAPDGILETKPVSTRVGNVRNDEPSLTEAVEPAG